jgi:hypothetical protein
LGEILQIKNNEGVSVTISITEREKIVAIKVSLTDFDFGLGTSVIFGFLGHTNMLRGIFQLILI